MPSFVSASVQPRETAAGTDLQVGMSGRVNVELRLAAPTTVLTEKGPLEVTQVSLWADDEYHASQYGSYLEALTIFGTLTGVDPRTLGASEQAAMDLGIAPDVAVGLQNVAYAQITAIPEPSTWLLMGMGSVVLVFAARRRARPDA